MSTVGKIELIIGCMFSSKTTTLISKIERLTIANKKCIVLNHSSDNRYTSENKLSSHSNLIYPARKCNTLLDLIPELDDYDCIGIDEGQFFSDLVEFAETMANKDKIIIISGLVGDFQRNSFGNIPNLIPKADNIIFLQAVCSRCYNDNAAFSQRYNSNNNLQTIVGGIEVYRAVCRKCFFK